MFEVMANSRFSGGLKPPKPLLTDELLGCLSIKKWAHDKFKISFYPQPRVKRRRLLYPAHRLAVAQRTWKSDYGCDIGRSYAYEKQLSKIRQEAASFLDSSSKFQEGAKEISGYGGLPKRKIFRRSGADRIQEAGLVGWRESGGKGIILTGTRPGSMDEGEKVFMSYSGYLVSLMRQWFRDVVGSDATVFFVWEPHKSGQLHLHACIMSKNLSGLNKLLEMFWSKWFGWLQDLSAKSGVDLFRKNVSTTWKNSPEVWQSDAQFLKKNPARYFSKYLTKGVRQLARNVNYYPSRWWGVDRKTTQAANQLRVKFVLSGATLVEIKESVKKLVTALKNEASQVVSYCNPKFPEFGGIVGFVSEEKQLDMLLQVSKICSEERKKYAEQ
jgi:hypothetical protein